MVSKGVRRRGSRVDLAMVALVRLVHDDRWSIGAAGERLRDEVPDDAVLRRAHARVAGALVRHPGGITERSAAVLDAALAASPGTGGAGR